MPVSQIKYPNVQDMQGGGQSKPTSDTILDDVLDKIKAHDQEVAKEVTNAKGMSDLNAVDTPRSNPLASGVAASQSVSDQEASVFSPGLFAGEAASVRSKPGQAVSSGADPKMPDGKLTSNLSDSQLKNNLGNLQKSNLNGQLHSNGNANLNTSSQIAAALGKSGGSSQSAVSSNLTGSSNPGSTSQIAAALGNATASVSGPLTGMMGTVANLASQGVLGTVIGASTAGGVIGGPVASAVASAAAGAASYTGSTSTGSSGGRTIILEPRQMFNTLQETQQATQDLVSLINKIAGILEAVSNVTFAIGFAELIKTAEGEINQVGSAVVAANNAFNSACRDVVNQLVAKFAPEGARSDYSSPAFQPVTIRVNEANRAQVYPGYMRVLFEDQQDQNRELSRQTGDIRNLFSQTANFWQGAAAEKTRSAFESKVVPLFDELLTTLNKIVAAGLDWVDNALSFEQALGV